MVFHGLSIYHIFGISLQTHISVKHPALSHPDPILSLTIRSMNCHVLVTTNRTGHVTLNNTFLENAVLPVFDRSYHVEFYDFSEFHMFGFLKDETTTLLWMRRYIYI